MFMLIKPLAVKKTQKEKAKMGQMFSLKTRF